MHEKCSHFERGPRNFIFSLLQRNLCNLALLTTQLYNVRLLVLVSYQYNFSILLVLNFFNRKFRDDKYKVLGRNDYQWPVLSFYTDQ